MPHDIARLSGIACLLACLPLPAAAQETGIADKLPPPVARDIDFVQDIRPIFADRCLKCHGADKHEAGLRLHSKQDGLAGGDNGPVIVPGKAGDSRLMRYVTGLNDDGAIMPPEGEGERLSTEQVALLRTWIDRGAEWPEGGNAQPGTGHWSFQPIVRPAVPLLRDIAAEKREAIRNGIDAFVVQRLEAEGIAPSPQADRPTLIRRLSLDLLGLPPTPGEVDAFVDDLSPDAYERLVERLLASPHYGERWGRHWLDAARYADSDGYEKDLPRPYAWRWRNWVIDALNRDLPFDEFTVEQLAGDLLPEAGDEQRVATGFHRNTLTNREGGVDPEEDRVKATVDRVNTTGTVWLGLTVGCAQCHSHKYDPLSQREYYGLFAFFNSVSETEVPAPLPAEAAAYRQARRAFDDEHARLQATAAAFEREQLPARQAEWEKIALTTATNWTVLVPASAVSASGATLTPQPDGSLLASGANPATDTYTITGDIDLAGITAVRLETLPDASLPAQGPGRVAHGNFVLSELRAEAAAADQPETKMPLVLEGAAADFAQGKDMAEFPAAAAIDGKTDTGWAVAPVFGKRHVAVFQVKEPPAFTGALRLTLTLDQQHGMQHTIGRLRLSLTAAPRPVGLDAVPDEIAAILRTAPDARTPEQKEQLARHYRTVDPELARLNQAVAEHAHAAPRPSANAPALAELSTPRVTNVLIRGDFLRKGVEVSPGTPAVLPALASGARPSRLDLARWLVEPANPLTARVTVNRVWRQYFGRGLVSTVDDFGTQGEKPSHPELLDWLASEFVARGWSLKALHRLIVTSGTYRQSSHARPELIDRDPNNVLLARQARLRVEAEVVRDLSLAASGLLAPMIGGASVRPPQPAGISELTYADSAKWQESSGADRYRRGMYTHFQRTSPYPMLMTFDSPDSNVACTRRERSNTPLQALTLLNDPVFVECAQSYARRVLMECQGSTRDRLSFAFRLGLGRQPDADELNRLESLLDELRAACRADPAAAAPLAGPSSAPGVEVAEAAAWTALARLLLNLDEFVTRE